MGTNQWWQMKYYFTTWYVIKQVNEMQTYQSCAPTSNIDIFKVIEGIFHLFMPLWTTRTKFSIRHIIIHIPVCITKTATGLSCYWGMTLNRVVLLKLQYFSLFSKKFCISSSFNSTRRRNKGFLNKQSRSKHIPN